MGGGGGGERERERELFLLVHMSSIWIYVLSAVIHNFAVGIVVS